MTQWIRLHLPFCGPGFKSQAHHLCFYSQILYYICHWIEKKMKINKQMPGLAHILTFLVCGQRPSRPRNYMSCCSWNFNSFFLWTSLSFIFYHYLCAADPETGIGLVIIWKDFVLKCCYFSYKNSLYNFGQSIFRKIDFDKLSSEWFIFSCFLNASCLLVRATQNIVF